MPTKKGPFEEMKLFLKYYWYLASNITAATESFIIFFNIAILNMVGITCALVLKTETEQARGVFKILKFVRGGG